MHDPTMVVDSFCNEVWEDGKWVLTNGKGKKLDLFTPEDYWFPDQLACYARACEYEHNTTFVRVWARLIMSNVGAMEYAKAEKAFLKAIDKPKGKDHSKAEKAGAEAEQNYFKKVLEGA